MLVSQQFTLHECAQQIEYFIENAFYYSMITMFKTTFENTFEMCHWTSM